MKTKKVKKGLQNKTLKKSNMFAMAFACALFAVPGMQTKAADTILSGDCGENVKYVLDSDYVLTISGTGEMMDYDFEEVNDDYEPNMPWADYSHVINKVVIEDGVTSIGALAFFDFDVVKTVEIADSVIKINNEGFENADGLTNLTLPKQLESIGDSVFSNCKNLTNIEIPDSVTHIGNNVFSYSSALKSIKWPDSTPKISENAFSYCLSLQEVTLPDTLTSIGWGAFNRCTSLKNIEIPESIAEIEGNAFCGSGIEKMVWPKNIISVGTSVFEDSALKEITLPEGLIEINKSAFEGTRLKTVDIPDSVRKLGERAFAECKALKTVTISDELYGNTDLLDVFAETPYLDKISKEKNSGKIESMEWSFDNGVLTLNCNGGPCIRMEKDLFYLRRNEVNEVVIKDASLIEKDCFYTFDALSKVSMNEGISEIGERAFSRCGKIEDINLPASVKKIGDYSFSGTGITKITLPKELEILGVGAFDYAALQEITVPGGVKRIEDYTFYSCYYLNKVVISEGTEFIGYEAFQHCKNLKEVTLPSTLKKVRTKAFEFCSELSALEFPAGMVSIGNNSFAYCPNLTDVKLPCTFSKQDFLHAKKTKITFYHDEQESFTWNKSFSKCSYVKQCTNCDKKSDEKECEVSRKVVKKASFKKDGKITVTATCGKAKDTQEITVAKIKDVKLEYKDTFYSGQPKQPKVTAVDADGKEINSKYYTVTYSKNIKIGKANALVKFKDSYLGTINLQFKINPKKTTITTVTPKATKLTVNWNKQAVQTTGYEVQIATDKKFTKDVKTITTKKNSTLSCKFTKLKRGTKYYVRIRTYKKLTKNTYYSNWYEHPKAVKTNK